MLITVDFGDMQKHQKHRVRGGLWHNYGIGNLGLAGLTHDLLLDVFIGRYDIIDDIINDAQKGDFYCYVARFIHIQKKICGRLF